jgi:hypothetical protein
MIKFNLGNFFILRILFGLILSGFIVIMFYKADQSLWILASICVSAYEIILTFLKSNINDN